MDNEILTNEAVDEIEKFLIADFYKKSGIDVNEHPEEKYKFYQKALKVKKKLEHVQLYEVTMENILETYSLHTEVRKDTVQAWVDINHFINSPAETPPDLCPLCTHPMTEWTCFSCGLHMESPEQKVARLKGSISPQDNIPPGYLLSCDPLNGRVFLVNTLKMDYVVWELDTRNFNLTHPRHVVLLPDQNLLITDSTHQRIIICDHFGNLIWELSEDLVHQLELKKPIKATYWNLDGQDTLMIVDQDTHQILGIDYFGKVLWRFGLAHHPGPDFGHLDNPHDAQITPDGTLLITDTGNHRIIELKSPLDTEVVQILDREHHHLKTPLFARRLLNSHTLIIDSENFRVIELNIHGKISNKCHYYKPSMEYKFKLENPINLYYNRLNHILLMDAERIYEMDLIHKHLLWFAYNRDLKMHRILDETEYIYHRQRYSKSFHDFTPPKTEPTFDLDETLRKVKIFRGAPDTFFTELKTHLKYEEFYRDDTIMKKGEKGDCMYIIRKGWVEVLKDDEKSILASLTVGDLMGEMSLILHEPRSASIRTRNYCELYKLTQHDFDKIIRSYPFIKERIEGLAFKRKHIQEIKRKEISPEAQDHLKDLVKSFQKRYLDFHHDQLQKHDLTTNRAEWRLYYDQVEHHTIHEAIEEHFDCYELHFTLTKKCRMKPVRIALVCQILDKLGDVIKVHPHTDNILDDKIDDTFAVTLTTHTSKEQILHDAYSVALIDHVDIYPISF